MEQQQTPKAPTLPEITEEQDIQTAKNAVKSLIEMILEADRLQAIIDAPDTAPAARAQAAFDMLCLIMKGERLEKERIAVFARDKQREEYKKWQHAQAKSN